MESVITIKPYKVDANDQKSPKMCEELGVCHPFTMYIIGIPGSGKTVLTCNLVTNKSLFNRYYDYVYLMSATGGLDDTFKNLKLPNERVITDNFEDNLDKIVDKQEKDILKNGFKNSKKALVIFEDMTSQRSFQYSKSFKRCFTDFRHFNMSCIICCHKYKAFERTCRVVCHHVIAFPCTDSEKKQISSEFQSGEFKKKEFIDMMNETFKPEKTMIRPFLHINNKAQIEDRFRKGFTKIMIPDNRFKFIFNQDAVNFSKSLKKKKN